MKTTANKRILIVSSGALLSSIIILLAGCGKVTIPSTPVSNAVKAEEARDTSGCTRDMKLQDATFAQSIADQDK